MGTSSNVDEKTALQNHIVPDYESQDCDVVLVRHTTYFWETPGGREFGMGRDWGGFDEGEVSSRATWGQGGRDRTTQKEGVQVTKGN
jgi:hypothetical protein